MSAFGAASLAQLATTHPDLQRVFTEVVKHWDCKVLEGERTEAQAKANVAKGVSKTPDSKHLRRCSKYPVGVDAVDVAPFPLHWPTRAKDTTPAEVTRATKDVALFYFFAGYVLATADALGVKLRYGGDWNGNRAIDDQSFDDCVHFELVRP